MATYNFRCPNCHVDIEVIRKFGDNTPPVCTECDTEMKQVIGANPVILKGKGWYKPGHFD